MLVGLGRESLWQPIAGTPGIGLREKPEDHEGRPIDVQDYRYRTPAVTSPTRMGSRMTAQV